jgi:hypothetical protein
VGNKGLSWVKPVGDETLPDGNQAEEADLGNSPGVWLDSYIVCLPGANQSSRVDHHELPDLSISEVGSISS